MADQPLTALPLLQTAVSTSMIYTADQGTGTSSRGDQSFLASLLALGRIKVKRAVLTDGATVTPDLSVGNLFYWQIGAVGRTLANPTNLPTGSEVQGFSIIIQQDATGNRTITSYGSKYRAEGGAPTLSTGANAIDVFNCLYDPTLDLVLFTYAIGFTAP